MQNLQFCLASAASKNRRLETLQRFCNRAVAVFPDHEEALQTGFDGARWHLDFIGFIFMEADLEFEPSLLDTAACLILGTYLVRHKGFEWFDATWNGNSCFAVGHPKMGVAVVLDPDFLRHFFPSDDVLPGETPDLDEHIINVLNLVESKKGRRLFQERMTEAGAVLPQSLNQAHPADRH